MLQTVEENLNGITPAAIEEPDSQESIFEGIVTIDLPAFKGPLDVLCFLLRRGEIDSRSISPLEVAQQVLSAIPLLAGRDIIGAGTSIYYDALMLEVKAALLGKIGLPEVKMVQPGEEAVEPGGEREYSEFAAFLARRYRSWIGTFPRGDAAGDYIRPLLPVTEKTRKALLQAYYELLNRPQQSVHMLASEEEPIARRREQLITRIPLHQPMTLQEVWEGESLLDKVLTFLTLLELATQQVVVIEQRDDDSIWITRIKTPLQLVDNGFGELTLFK